MKKWKLEQKPMRLETEKQCKKQYFIEVINKTDKRLTTEWEGDNTNVKVRNDEGTSTN